MYLPAHFAETDAAEVAALMAAFPLACLVAETPEGLVANHLPLLVGPDGALISHVALANDLHRLVAEGQEVMAVFRGEEAYVSPNLYPSKAVHHRHVPTWNYQAVHVHGPIAFRHDEKSKREEPRWDLVDVRYVRTLERAITLDEIRGQADRLGEEFALIRKGNRLSVLPVTAAQWKIILSLE